MRNTLYIVALNDLGFDFSKLPEDLQKTASWVLSAPKEYNAQVELLDDVTWRSMVQLYPNDDVVLSVESVKPETNPDLSDNFNTMAYDPNELLPGSDPANSINMGKECLEILNAKNEDLNRSGFYIQTAYLDKGETPEVITVIYYTHDTFVQNKLTDIFAFIEQSLTKDFNIKYPVTVSKKIVKLFQSEPKKWDNSVSECTNSSILLFNDKEVVCTYQQPQKD